MKIIGRHYARFRDVRQSEIDIADVSFRQFRIDSFFLGENNFKTLQAFYIHKQLCITPCIKCIIWRHFQYIFQYIIFIII